MRGARAKELKKLAVELHRVMPDTQKNLYRLLKAAYKQARRDGKEWRK